MKNLRYLYLVAISTTISLAGSNTAETHPVAHDPELYRTYSRNEQYCSGCNKDTSLVLDDVQWTPIGNKEGTLNNWHGKQWDTYICSRRWLRDGNFELIYVQDGVTYEIHATWSGIEDMKSLTEPQCSSAKTEFW
ncbi:hypothetical protein GN244_ATG01937 [Phytophthora infestans]|uniref:Secreted RxLR effector peptide protein n=1 Tax=Phytophthora infestans TaxID=4787 RepID=A0A833T3G1_PHYIN|nr:hypothetical protein GN244_ATG01937 [Phytophthora infestans]KAF4139932.1 hypothetical protein GN958_ATG10921 [Phytophthora infestans]